MMRLAFALSTTLAVVALGGTAWGDASEYRIEPNSVAASASTDQAAEHPDFTISFALGRDPSGELPSTTLRTTFELPPGLLGNPNAVPTCTASQLVETDPEDPSNNTGCPQDSQVGVTEVQLHNEGGEAGFVEPVFNIQPRGGEPARLGFIADVYPVFVDTELRPDRNYAVTAKLEGVSSLIPLLGATTTLWGVPAEQSHDAQRSTPYEAAHNHGVPETPSGRRSSGLVPVPFMRNPTQCGVAQGVTITATPYAPADLQSEVFAPMQQVAGCGMLQFGPRLSLSPTTALAGSASGLDASLTFPRDGLRFPNLPDEGDQKRVEVTMPEGVTINSGQAERLGACSEADFARETADSGPGQGCPESAKIGTVNALSPLLDEPAQGSLFVATPNENPFGTLIAVYLVLRVADRGVIVKLAGKVTSDPVTGQLVATFGEPPYEIPQLPVSEFRLHFREGPRSPLVTPERCGSFESTADFTSWGGQQVTTHPSFVINGGPDGGPCPTGQAPFRPELQAGAINNNAGSFSPYYLRITKRPAEQDLIRISTIFPRGSLAKLAGVAKCSDAAIVSAARRSGLAELATPSCPPDSRIGHLAVGAGAAAALTYVPGDLYLAGPYKGAPLSIAAIVPALAGPFDLGTVVTRLAVTVNSVNGEVEVDGGKSDPIPHILAGIPLRVRDLRVYLDRPNFTINPTSCDPDTFKATVEGIGVDPLSEPETSLVSIADRFQAAGCAALPFRPRLSLGLRGAVKRTSHPRLIASLTAKPGEANIAKAQVKLPKAAFLDNAHIGGVCTRVQFAADACPPSSVYGRAAAITPLLDQPLSGPVYLRSSTHPLPDLVAKLKGPEAEPIEIDLTGKTDSVNDALRNTFEAVPDAPVSKFHLELFGGKRGLIELSSGLCRHPRADVKLDGQNGKTHDTRPLVRSSCPETRKSHKRRSKE
jgi:hypothetical protein